MLIRSSREARIDAWIGQGYNYSTVEKNPTIEPHGCCFDRSRPVFTRTRTHHQRRLAAQARNFEESAGHYQRQGWTVVPPTDRQGEFLFAAKKETKQKMVSAGGGGVCLPSAVVTVS